jgi:hypothetical protein
LRPRRTEAAKEVEGQLRRQVRRGARKRREWEADARRLSEKVCRGRGQTEATHGGWSTNGKSAGKLSAESSALPEERKRPKGKLLLRQPFCGGIGRHKEDTATFLSTETVWAIEHSSRVTINAKEYVSFSNWLWFFYTGLYLQKYELERVTFYIGLDAFQRPVSSLFVPVFAPPLF